jgi:Ca2+-binding RTX toxin-like protein
MAIDLGSVPGGIYVLDNQDYQIKVLGDGIVIAGNGNDTIDIVGSGIVIAGNGNDSITIGEDPGTGVVFVGDGNDTITLANGGEIFQIGAGGNDTISLGAGNDTVFETGTAQISGAFGTATVTGGDLTINQATVPASSMLTDDVAHFGNVTMVAGASAVTEMEGGFGSQVSMLGGAGLNIFDGGHGSDTMTGGSGVNFYQFDAASGVGGNTLITNFTSGHDQIYLEGQTLASLTQNNDVTVTGGNTFIKLDGGATTIELKGVTNLQETDVSKFKLG